MRKNGSTMEGKEVMHSSSMLRMKWFLDNYRKYFTQSGQIIRVLDLGSYDINGCYKSLFDEAFSYYGVDMEKGPNVDIVLEDVYNWKEIESNSFDIAISGQAFEHIEYPWLSIKELSRILKPDGILCIIAPHTAREDQYPYDCYRFYSDGLPALVKWSNLELLHSSIAGVPDYFVSEDWDDSSNDAMIIAKKSGQYKLLDTPQFIYERRVYDFEYKYRYKLLLKWFKYISSDKSIASYLVRKGYKNLAVLAVDEVASLFINEILSNSLQNEMITINCILTYKKNIHYSGIPVCHINNLDEKVEVVIIADPDYHKNITNYLEEKLKKRVPLLNIEFIIDELLKK